MTFQMKMVHMKQTARKMTSRHNVGRLVPQRVIYVLLGESPEHQAPPEDVEPKDVKQETEVIPDTPQEQEQEDIKEIKLHEST
jgi:hypothetical protein